MTGRTAALTVAGSAALAGVVLLAVVALDPQETSSPTTPDVSVSVTVEVTIEPSTPDAAPPPTVAATTAPTRRAPAAGPTTTRSVRPTATRRTTRPTPEPSETEPVTGAGYDNCTELRVDYPAGVPRAHTAYEDRFDRDGDGWACEITDGALLNTEPVANTPTPAAQPTTTSPAGE